MTRGIAFKVESNVLIAVVQLRAANGDVRDFPVSPPSKVIVFALRDAEREGILHVEARAPSGTPFKADLPADITTWAIDVANPNVNDQPDHKPGLVINWKPLAWGGGLIAVLLAAKAYLAKNREHHRRPEALWRVSDRVDNLTERRLP